MGAGNATRLGLARFDVHDTEPWPAGVGGGWAITVHADARLVGSIPPGGQDAMVHLGDDRAELDSDPTPRRWRRVLPGGSVAVVLFRIPRIRTWRRSVWVVLDNDRRRSLGQQWWFAHRRDAQAHYRSLITQLTSPEARL